MGDLDNYKTRIVTFGNKYKILCGGTKLAEARHDQFVLYKNIVDGTWYIGSCESVVEKELTEKLYKHRHYLLERVLNGKWYIVDNNLEIKKEYIR
jgi:hypothetical protein